VIGDDQLADLATYAFVVIPDLWERGCSSGVQKNGREGFLDLAGWWIGRMERYVQKEGVMGCGILFLRRSGWFVSIV
jgi:hypothetical protein